MTIMLQNIMIIKPLRDNIYFKVEEKNTTSSGIILTGPDKQKTVFGEVLDVGPDVKTIAKGDKIIFANYAVSKIEIDGAPYFTIAEDLVIAKAE
jgi:chaperonin GroES